MTKKKVMVYTRTNDMSIFNGTSYKGTLDVTYQQLVDIFGPSLGPTEDKKCSNEWGITIDGEPVMIYDWKCSKLYLGDEEGLDPEDITKWNVGGNNKIVVEELKELIEEKFGNVEYRS